jgi:CHAT domain-containing protein
MIPVELVENESVTFEKFKEMDLCNSVLHFSTHGVFPQKMANRNPFANSGIVISDGNSLPDANLVARGETTHLLSPQQILQNGLQLKESHVTMMACVSGLSLEGLGGDALGLDWALSQAGAKSILASHWMVSAAAAADFFRLFYNKWLMENKPRGKAFRETVIELRTSSGKNANAHCWAAFSLSGDWR